MAAHCDQATNFVVSTMWIITMFLLSSLCLCCGISTIEAYPLLLEAGPLGNVESLIEAEPVHQELTPFLVLDEVVEMKQQLSNEDDIDTDTPLLQYVPKIYIENTEAGNQQQKIGPITIDQPKSYYGYNSDAAGGELDELPMIRIIPMLRKRSTDSAQILAGGKKALAAMRQKVKLHSKTPSDRQRRKPTPDNRWMRSCLFVQACVNFMRGK